MAKTKVTPYERQAQWSIILAGLGGVACLGLIAIVFQKFNMQEFAVVMRGGGMRYFAILGATAFAALATTGGFFLGLSSAGHKRNKLSKLSWLGFWLSVVVMTATLCTFAIFWNAKEVIRG